MQILTGAVEMKSAIGNAGPGQLFSIGGGQANAAMVPGAIAALTVISNAIDTVVIHAEAGMRHHIPKSEI